MIGIVVKGMTWLKVLQPIMDELHGLGQPYVLYHTNNSPTPYNDPTIANMRKSSETIIPNASKVSAFKNNKHLVDMVKRDGVKKLVAVEIYSSLKNQINELKKCNIKLYSISWLIDAFWHTDPRCILAMDRVYYTTKYVKETIHKFLNIKEDPGRDRLLGSPLLPYPTKKQSDGNKLLVLIPNMKKADYRYAFEHEFYFGQALRKLSVHHNLLYKTRPKQWFYRPIKAYTKNDIISDKYKMRPPPTWSALKQSHSTMLFFSSGIFEIVLSGNYACNVPINLKRYKQFGWPPDRVKSHFSAPKNSLYNFDGVVESVRLSKVIDGRWKLNKGIDLDARQEWIERFVGYVSKNPAREIVEDIIES